MKLTRAIPALLALSMLTGCDMNAFLPKDGGIKKDTTPTTQTVQELTQAELKSVAAFQSGLADAANQGATAAGSVGALKSVSGLKSVAAYRISTIDLPESDDWSENFTIDGKFTGRSLGQTDTKGDEGPENDEKSYYLDGAFTPVANFTATGKAMLKTIGNVEKSADPTKFEGQVELDLTITSAPESAAGLQGAKLEMSITKPKEALTTLLTGTFGVTLADAVTATSGKFGIQLFNDAWWVELPYSNSEAGQTFVKLNFAADGSGTGSIVGSKMEGDKAVADYDVKLASVTWNKDGIGRIKLPSGAESAFMRII